MQSACAFGSVNMCACMLVWYSSRIYLIGAPVDWSDANTHMPQVLGNEMEIDQYCSTKNIQQFNKETLLQYVSVM